MINKNLVVDIKTSIKVAMIKLSKSAKKCLMVLNDQKLRELMNMNSMHVVSSIQYYISVIYEKQNVTSDLRIF